MMEYWTFMWITALSGQLADSTTALIIYPSLAQCEAAIQPVTATLPYDFSVICEESTAPSVSAIDTPDQKG